MVLDANWYNGLPTIEGANAAFPENERPSYFQKIAPLLQEYGGKYSLCLVHQHVALVQGEFMVADGLITLPQNIPPTPDPRVIPSSWDSKGRAFEWVRLEPTEVPTQPPPDTLLQRFLAIVGEKSVLGLCIDSAPTTENHVWLEHIEHSRRRHIRRSTPRDQISGGGVSVFDSCWSLNSTDGAAVLTCCAVCVAGRH